MLISEARLRQLIRGIVLEAAEKQIKDQSEVDLCEKDDEDESQDEGQDDESKKSKKVKSAKSAKGAKGSWRKNKPDPLHHLKSNKKASVKKSSKKDLYEEDEMENDVEVQNILNNAFKDIK